LENKCIAIIDCDSIAFSAGTGIKLLDSNNQPIKVDNKFTYRDKTDEEIKEYVDFLMNKLLLETKATGYIAYIKGKGNFRYSINPDYKANRPKESPKWWAYTKKCFIDNWGAIEVNGIEVDDAVNITRLNIPNSFISAIDKDLLLLEGLHYNWRKSEWVNTNYDEALYAFWSDFFIGQIGDNIKGIPKIGEVNAKKILITENTFDQNLHTVVLRKYIDYYGEYKGISEFYKNYYSLKILENYDGFEIPEIREFIKSSEDVF
jgi:5'-3' exonuclease